MKKIIFLSLLGLLSNRIFSVENAKLGYIENKGQWEDVVRYKADLKGGYVFLEKNTLTYLFVDASNVHKHGQLKNKYIEVNGEKTLNPDFKESPKSNIIKQHAYKAIWLGANENVELLPAKKESRYYNYFLGNDPKKWASNVGLFNEIKYQNLYNKIDLLVYSNDEQMKSDYIVHQDADPSIIKIKYDGTDGVEIDENENLKIKTSINTVIEYKPYAYQLIYGTKKDIPCKYVLTNDVLSFQFPSGYNKEYDLVIDPTLVFSTYSGSPADNWGSSATYDAAGNMYLGGMALATGYPTTTGAFQTTFGGGTLGNGTSSDDIVITKFNATGTAPQIFSTYLGGNKNELISSLFVTANNELIVLASTGSGNFPVTAGCYDNSFNGGSDILAIGGIDPTDPFKDFDFPNGSDIAITKFNAAGTALLGSTFFGGSGNDGLNTGSALLFNYGDDTRGDIEVDKTTGDIYIASTTSSTNIPGTAGKAQPAYKGGPTDGLLAKFNSTLTALQWASYYGSTNQDACYSIRLDKSGNVFVCGGTNTTTLTGTAGGLNPAFLGGGSDGFVAKFNSTGTTILAATYLGTNKHDEAYMMDLDEKDNVYIFGQTLGAYPTTAGVYKNTNGKQFIQKLNNNLNTSIYSTIFGSNGSINISPTALLVDKCENVHAVGWGGEVNVEYQVSAGYTNGMAVTGDAYKSSTDGSDFYLITFNKDAASLLYASYFGENGGGGDHVDGGTSRFDKNGLVYQAVCASCGGTDAFPTTPGAFSNQNKSSNCNMAGFKFQFNLQSIQILNVTFPNASGCAPLTNTFSYTSNKPGTSYYWNFGDGDTSTAQFPTHTYTTVGVYTVKFVIKNASTCNGADSSTATVTVTAGAKPTAAFTIDSTNKCTTKNIIFTNTSTSGVTYLWDFGDGATSNSTAATVNHTYATNGLFIIKLVAYNSALCTTKDSIIHAVNINPTPATVTVAADKNNICPGTNVTFTATPGTGLTVSNYQWQVNGGNVGTNSATFSSTTLTNGALVKVTITATGSCITGSPATSNVVTMIVTSPVTPTFNTIGPLCQNSAAPSLPASSTNATPITGTWSPATINTTVTGSVTYTFTPTAGQCATTATLSVTINPQVTPMFNAIGSLCQNSAAPTLPASSTNATPITGTWSPATINTATAATTTYTFTPNAGQCATTKTLVVTVNPQVTPTFNAIGPLCQNSAAPTLPASSTNATPIPGTWSPATINTATAATTTYTFTPNAGQCATTKTLVVTVNPQVTPMFNAIGPLCQNSAAPTLPASSTNATPIPGTWSPATINTATAATTTYTFIPNAGQCATTKTLVVTVNPQVTPTFNAIGPLCQNSAAPTLPASSTNATPIPGTWSPATINTTTTGTTTYTFTPTAGQCATTATLPVTITTLITPTFNAIGPLCQNSAAPTLPASSTNATPITGTWSPATINTASAATTTYTFTPNAGQCATTKTLVVTVNPQVTPTFNAIGPLCQNSAAPSLPASSTNATPITGTWSPATINTTVTGSVTYTFTPTAGQCATTATLSVTINPQVTPTFNAIGPLCQNSAAPTLPASSTNATPITGTWSPATINTTTTGTTTYTFTANAGQCATTATLPVTITTLITPTFNAIGPLCQNSAAPILPASSTNATPITGTWSPATINTATAATTTYTFTPNAGQCATTKTLVVTVNPQVTPTFNAIGPLCQNSAAPILPASSTNATPITGTWSPATINTTATGTTTYTFTPTAGQCATTATLPVTITTLITPTFNAIGPLCQNSAAPTLPASSTNATPITGTWSPATINTASAATTTYTFTPNAGQCATIQTLSVTINPQITPTFNAIGPLCQNSAAPTLPASSTNATPITGTWSPATINTASAATTTYTFTPNAGQCATIKTLTVTVNPQITPTFNAIGPLCQNSAAPTLPASSTNATPIPGTWSPATINTTATGATTYTFTPNAGQCATTKTLSVTVNPQVTPTFNAIGPLCQNSAAPILPASSTNATPITGTWNPATINTASAATTTYTFTPNAGQCATTKTLSVTVNPQITPTFTAIGQLCQNSTAPSLPASSTNASPITGTWNPATINTSVLGTTTYTFTPTTGQCAITATMSITITNQIVPTFNTIGTLCQNSIAPSLPASSTNTPPITGTWSPATISTASANTTVYTFTPNAGQCATFTTMSITVDPQITPTFNAIGPLCQNSAAPALATSSTNATPITGTWSPSAINTANAITTIYTFTPNAGQCAIIQTLSVTVNPQITPTFNVIGPLCQNSAAPALPASSTNTTPITGIWSPATINTSTATTTAYTFTPNAGQCATGKVITVTINPQIIPTFNQIGPLCQNSTAPALPASSTNATPITGTWSPATINTTSATTTAYTFTPNAGQCAVGKVITVTIIPQITPTFNQIGPLCQNSTAPALPASSTNATPITGTWNPSTISTASANTTAYTFTPSAGQCATTKTMTITVNPQVVPAFAAIGPLCQNSAAPALPATSANGIPGTWNPSTINTSSFGTTTYTFTPASGQCATMNSIAVTVNPVKTTNISKTICQGNTFTVGTQTFNSNGTFTVKLQTSSGCDSTIILTLTVTPNIVPAVAITSTNNDNCAGKPISFSAAASNTGVPPSYQWFVNSTAAGTNSPNFSSSTLNNGDVVKVIITTTATCANPATAISNIIPVTISKITYTKPPVIYCENDSAKVDLQVITTPKSGYSITWTNGNQVTTDTTSLYTVHNTLGGNIPFEIKYGNNCSVKDILPVIVHSLPPLHITPDAPKVKYEDTVQLDVSSTSTITNYNWTPASLLNDPGIRNPMTIVKASALFTVVVKDINKCINSDSVLVEMIDDCTNDYIYVPTAFSPNKDGVNDCFVIVSPPKLTDYKMTIFDRWGEKLFEAHDINTCWDGTYKGVDVQSDTYIYLISFKCYNGADLSKKGTIVILR